MIKPTSCASSGYYQPSHERLRLVLWLVARCSKWRIVRDEPDEEMWR